MTTHDCPTRAGFEAIRTGVLLLSMLSMVLLLTACTDEAPPEVEPPPSASESTPEASMPPEVESRGEAGVESEVGSDVDPDVDPGDPSADDSDVSDAASGAVEVVTTEYAIEMTERLETGWTTFDFRNEGDQTHFVVVYRLVDGYDIDDQLEHVVPAFDPLMEGLRDGSLTKADIGPFLSEQIPAWGLQMTYVGGAALLAPGGRTRSTFLIDEPGTYLAECYVKAPNGAWHTNMGMLHQIDVVAGDDAGTEPSADYDVRVTNSGVEAPAEVEAGRTTFRVAMIDAPETFNPYDLNLARLQDDTDLDEVVFWMDWTNVGGLRAPAPVEFLGGVEHMAAGSHGYATVDLAPGRYLWISEIDAATIHHEFSVIEADRTD